jgi:chaperonin GroES
MKKKKKTNKLKKAVKKANAPKDKVAKSGILPLGDRVLVNPFTEEEIKGGESHYGIVLPDSVTKEKSAQGKVLAVGEGKFVDGRLVPMQVKVGDKVIFSKYGYDEVEYEGKELYLLKEDSILAVIK